MPDKDYSSSSKIFSDRLKAGKEDFGEEASSDTREAIEEHHMGWLGRFWGGGKEKTGNITGAVLFLSFLSLLLFMFFDVSVDKDLLRYAVSGVISIITLSLGYLFGRRQ